MTGPGAPAAGAVRGVGVDALDIDRLRRALERRPALAERLFTDGERAYASAAADPAPRLAARFCAKEALAKALGVGIGPVAWRDVEVVRADSGAPALRLAGTAARLSAEAGVIRWHLSLSHTAALALAMVVGEGGSPLGGPAGAGDDR
ncbi:MAG: holo-ACP synthase [Acidobacteriota bacterium]|nr:holo-ACP synthase [Acidobacteriota bacterium]